MEYNEEFMKDSDFINNIFTSPPSEPGSILLTFDSEQNNGSSSRFIFENLLFIFVSGMKILFGNEDDKVDLSMITMNDFFLMQQYFKSFNIILNFSFIAESDFVLRPYAASPYGNEAKEKKSELKDFYFHTKVKKDDLDFIYKISFDYHHNH